MGIEVMKLILKYSMAPPLDSEATRHAGANRYPLHLLEAICHDGMELGAAIGPKSAIDIISKFNTNIESCTTHLSNEA